MLVRYKETISELLEIEPNLKIFVVVDLACYVLYFVWFGLMVNTINVSTLKCHQLFYALLSLFTFIYAQWAYVLTFNDDIGIWVDEFKVKKPSQASAATDPNGAGNNDTSDEIITESRE